MNSHDRHAQIKCDTFFALGTDMALGLLHDSQTRDNSRLFLVSRVFGKLAIKAGLNIGRKSLPSYGLHMCGVHRSISPKTISKVPMMATVSEIICPRVISSMADKCANPGARIFKR